MDEIIRKFCLKMKMYKIDCSTVYKCAMFQGFLKRFGIDDATVKQGFYVLGDNACRHYWVELKHTERITDPSDWFKLLARHKKGEITLESEQLPDEETMIVKYTSKIDITRYLASVPFPSSDTELVEVINENTKRIDIDNKLVKENEAQFEAFESNIKQFWKDAPMSIKKFKH